ncbi:MAG TPA: transglutaminase-like domain-containing protein [Candidatus Eisenbacteria bacterium]|nr:transglutaminase-like domain-containing protein [Candidatus Eisenbacteria bacterium]
MTRSLRLIALAFVFLLISTVALLPHSSSAGTARVDPAPSQRSFSFTYQVHVPSDPDMKTTHLWIPLPQNNTYQSVTGLKIESAVSHSEGHDPEYDNPFYVFTPTPAQAAAGYDVTLTFDATRREHKVDVDTPAAKNATVGPLPNDPLMKRYLEPDKLVPLNGTIAELAKEHTVGDTTPLEKARHIYEYVVATMRYDKSGTGWGHGDAIWACTSKRGNCTDFHSLFIGMMRSVGIPARFEIGFPLPDGKSEGDIPGYHCWAEFYLHGVGWIPVDASEAWKHPDKHNYFFGAHDDNRVFFTYGRDITLSSQQKGAPLNYFIYPYAEADGQPVKDLTTHFSFRDLPTAAD